MLGILKYVCESSTVSIFVRAIQDSLLRECFVRTRRLSRPIFLSAVLQGTISFEIVGVIETYN